MIPTNETTKNPKLRALQIGMEWKTTQSGGLDRIFENLMQGLPSVGVDVMGLVEGPLNTTKLNGEKIRTYASGRSGSLRKIIEKRKAIFHAVATYDPQIIAIHFAFFAFGAIRSLKNRAVVTHFHGPWSGEAEYEGTRPYVVAVKRFIEHNVYKRSDQIITVSKAFKQLVIEQFNIPPHKITVVPGSVDIKRFAVLETKQQARDILRWSQDRPTLVVVRRLAPRMGIDRLISAMVAIVAVEPNAMLYIAGNGPLKTMLSLQISDLNLENNVKMLGFVPEEHLPLIFRAADINVVPTTALEGFGLVAAESLAAGTPSMVTAVGGLPEIVEPLSKHLLFRSSKSNDLADDIISVLKGEIVLPNSDECRAYAAANFNNELSAQRTADVYRSLV